MYSWANLLGATASRYATWWPTLATGTTTYGQTLLVSLQR
jgi:hypothetical protein